MNNSKILTVDDDPSLSRTMDMILSKKGFIVNTAKNGYEAIDTVRQDHYDFILMDIKMPLLDGVEAYKRIKEIDTDAIVIMTTAYAVEDKINEAIMEGAFGVLYKPLDIDQVLQIINDFEQGKKCENVLVVDDDNSINALISRILRKDGYTVDCANSGLEAIEKGKKTNYNLYMIDMKMPGMDGNQTYKELKKIDPSASFILMTGYKNEMQSFIDEAISSGAFTCLYKPFQMIDVLNIVKTSLAV